MELLKAYIKVIFGECQEIDSTFLTDIYIC